MVSRDTFRAVLDLGLCPKACLENISEFGPGVEVVRKYCEQFPPDWGSPLYVEQFVEHFQQADDEAVRISGKKSALAHQEHRHASFSGRHFVEGLPGDAVQRDLFGPRGTAERLAPFFGAPSALDAEMPMQVYRELVAVPVQLAPPRRDGDEPSRVSDNSYNSIDFLRCFSNMTSVFDAPQALFSQRLWNQMLRCQAKPSETRKFLAEAGLGMDVANEMIQSSPMNWTTFLVCICEVRQATALGPEFLQAAEGLQQRRDVQFALPGLCYCVRLVRRVAALLRLPAPVAGSSEAGAGGPASGGTLAAAAPILPARNGLPAGSPEACAAGPASGRAPAVAATAIFAPRCGLLSRRRAGATDAQARPSPARGGRCEAGEGPEAREADDKVREQVLAARDLLSRSARAQMAMQDMIDRPGMPRALFEPILAPAMGDQEGDRRTALAALTVLDGISSDGDVLRAQQRRLLGRPANAAAASSALGQPPAIKQGLPEPGPVAQGQASAAQGPAPAQEQPPARRRRGWHAGQRERPRGYAPERFRGLRQDKAERAASRGGQCRACKRCCRARLVPAAAIKCARARPEQQRCGFPARSGPFKCNAVWTLSSWARMESVSPGAVESRNSLVQEAYTSAMEQVPAPQSKREWVAFWATHREKLRLGRCEREWV
ncbi:unnamed protein product [Prorocentrum cordatum]|uniref:Uncharacterized protein n=1 Tax=Prorocentrum cordatum TaxID=2364126 RepID=A0ABN9THT1_9DINO|nr:unnamed protein product [Polarella glacialis]